MVGTGEPPPYCNKNTLGKIGSKNWDWQTPPPQLGQKTKFFDRFNLRAPLNVADEVNEGSNRLTLAFLKTSSHRCNSNLCVLFNLGLVSLPAHQLLRLFLLVSRLSPPCISLFPPWLRLWLVSSSSSSAALISAASRKAAEILSKLKIESCVKYPPATS